MRIIISNIVSLNGGDFAILESMMKVLRQTYGEHTEFIVYDLHAPVAAKYYPGIHFRTLIHVHYKFTGLKRKFYLLPLVSKISPLSRLMYAAKLHGNGRYKLARLLLTKKEKTDFENYANADIIISTGGTYLVENYPVDSRIYDYYFTLALGKPLVFFTQSLGPFKKPANQIAFKNIFDKASLILLRDEASFNNLKKIDVDVSKARICADVVFAETSPLILKAAKDKQIGTPLKVAISVREWKFFKGRTRQEGMDKYYNSVAAICEYITVKLKGEVVFISTCQAIKEYHVDDSLTAKNIYARLTDQAKKSTSVNSDFHTPDELKEIIKNFDIVISTRMHGAIQALNVGVPVLPIAYEFKTKELFNKLINKDFILDINTMEEEDSVKIFDQFLTDLPKFRGDLFDKVIEEHLSALQPIQYLKEELQF